MRLALSARRAAMLSTAALAAAGLSASPALAASVSVPMALATKDGAGASVGKITLSDAGHGVTLSLDLKGLPPGPHGFHVHEIGSCEPSKASDGTITPAGAAGPHLDPGKTGTHKGPEGQGHLGDLPLIQVAADGTAKQKLAAHRLPSIAALKGRSLMIHAGGDTYSDTPSLGGGGARLACGVIPG